MKGPEGMMNQMGIWASTNKLAQIGMQQYARRKQNKLKIKEKR